MAPFQVDMGVLVPVRNLITPSVSIFRYYLTPLLNLADFLFNCCVHSDNLFPILIPDFIWFYAPLCFAN